MQDTTLASLPTEILGLIHSRLFETDSTLRSCLALEATCKHLRSTLHSNTRYKEVRVNAGNLAAAQGASLFQWMESCGRRTDRLLLQNLELRHSTPALGSQAGVLQVGEVAVSATAVDTLEPLRGLLNLTSVAGVAKLYTFIGGSDAAVSLEPLAGLPALEHVDLSDLIWRITNLAPLRSTPTLSSLDLRSYPHADEVSQLDNLSSLTKLRKLELAGFNEVASLAPLSCLTSASEMSLWGFKSLDNVEPLRALSMLQSLDLALCGPISLQPLSQMSSMTALKLHGLCGGPLDAEYDLQPLSALSRTLSVLELRDFLLRSLPSIGSLGTTLRSLSVIDCKQQPPGVQLASLFSRLSRLTYLSVCGVGTPVDLDSVGQQLRCLQALRLLSTPYVTSLAALSSLTSLTSIGLAWCHNIDSIDPLAALTNLQSLHLSYCPLLTSLSPLTALQSLQQVRLMGYPQKVAASLSTSLQPRLNPAHQGAPAGVLVLSAHSHG
jgi:Leucine-rich repeat (LRR) protein